MWYTSSISVWQIPLHGNLISPVISRHILIAQLLISESDYEKQQGASLLKCNFNGSTFIWQNIPVGKDLILHLSYLLPTI